MHDWQQLTDLTQNKEITIERVKVVESGLSIEGNFELPPLARLNMEDQIFVAAFVKSHGSIKDMEQLFDISYPTVKNRLNRIAQLLEFVEVNPPSSRSDILTDLEQGKISVEEAEQKLRR